MGLKRQSERANSSSSIVHFNFASYLQKLAGRVKGRRHTDAAIYLSFERERERELQRRMPQCVDCSQKQQPFRSRPRSFVKHTVAAKRERRRKRKLFACRRASAQNKENCSYSEGKKQGEEGRSIAQPVTQCK